MTGYELFDTIVAPATPLAPSAIGIVRLSGPEAWRIAGELLHGLPPLERIEPRRAYVCGLPLPAGTRDTCVALLWAAPDSYTGDDIAELLLHGSPPLLRQVLAECQRRGARLAEPGEFTYRAHVAGKLDLAQAEAVQALIGAGSASAMTLAASQLAGLPGRRIADWQERLELLLAGIEVIHDYAADDLDASLDPDMLLTPAKLQSELGQLIGELDAALAVSARTRPLREGLTVAVCGPPNVGKSTLFNALLGHARALTAPEPGTTRDYLTETLECAGVRLTLVDTAGYRQAGADAVESAGIASSAQWARGADRVLWVTAADAEEAEVPEELAGVEVHRVVTRCDLLREWPAGDFHVSGLTGRGVPELSAALAALPGTLDAPALESFGARQAQAVAEARAALVQAVDALAAGMQMDAAALDLYAAHAALHGIFEQADRSEVVAKIFAGFCVGK